MSIGKRTALDPHLGRAFKLMGANTPERIFRLVDDEGNSYLFQALGDKQRITDIIQLPDDAPIPRGCKGTKELADVIVYQYDKQDNYRYQRTGPGGDLFSAAQFNRGYLLIDAGNGHPWLRVGIHNYKSTRPRAVFEYASDPMDDEDETAEGEE